MTEAQRIFQNTIIQIFGKVVITALALVGFGLATRHLGQEGFGYFSTILAFLAIFGILVDMGLQMTTTKLIADPQNNEGQILSNALTIRVVASIIFLGLAPLMIFLFPYPPIVKIGTLFASAGFVFSSLVNTITSFFQKNLIMQKVVIAEIIAKVIYLVAMILAVKANLGLLGIIGATILDSFFVFSILLFFASQKALIKPSFEKEVWKKILGHTWPIAVTITLNLIYFKGDIFIMSLIRPQTEVGLYGAPYRVLEVLINMAYLFLGLILPILATAYAVKNLDKIKSVLQSTFDFLIIFTMPMIVGGAFLGRPIMTLMAGDEFSTSGDIIKILFIATGLIFIASLFGYVIVAMNKQKEMIKFYALNAVISIVGYTYLITKYSYWGAAWMTVYTEGFILVTAAYVTFKNLKFLPKLNIMGKSIIASLIMALPLYFFADINFIIQIILGVTIYFLALLALKGYSKKTILELMAAKK